ncbi:MAG TPA: energy transducer TonB [Candidatus Baltobacteraceae bacterium]|nr:energy transducer TonB [Candidatus Baltobacteraceae bacterium]
MKRSALLMAAVIASMPLSFRPAPAAANAFCPATVAALADLAGIGHPGTWGVLLEVDRGDTRSIRVRVDTNQTRYAIDVNDVPLMTYSGVQMIKYFNLPAGEHVVAAWVNSTGVAPNQRLDCPVTSPWAPNLPPPQSPREQARVEHDRRSIVDGYSTRTLSVVAPIAFGSPTPVSCQQPYAALHALAPIRPAFPPEARAVNATGIVGVLVDVDDAGALVDARVVRSSGFAALDRAALDTVKRTRFAPALFACRPMAASAELTVGFGA